MVPIRIFISSVQSEFAYERRRLSEYFRNDALFRRYFVSFIFEELPAEDVSAQAWDATICPFATLDNIDYKRVEDWVDMAMKKRGYPIQYSEKNVPRILHHLHLMTEKQELRNAALLLFAKDPQEFFIESQIKCMVFPTKIKAKPILSYQVYGGTIFNLIDSAVSFVMQHINVKVGARTTDAVVDVEYEVPYGAVAEIITNAVVHRSYESNGSVQVMIFPDRIEVWNPGRLPFGLTPEKLAEEHESKPVNPILAEPIYMTGYIERAGTGTTDVVETCVAAGLRRPEYRQDGDFKVTIWRENDPQNVRQNDPQNCSSEDIVTQDNTEGFDGQNDPQNVRQNDPQNVRQNDPQKILESKVFKRQRKLFETILANRQMSKEDIATLLKVSQETIKRDLRSLRRIYEIEWIGASKTGHWVVRKK